MIDFRHAYGLHPVSYTHLDVYKRQVYYAGKEELFNAIYRAFPAPARQNNYRTPKKEKTIP